MKYGFIGLGKMAGAIINGMALSGEYSEDEVYGYNRSIEKTLKLKESCGIIPAESETDLVEKSDVVILAVKPQMMAGVLDKIKGVVKPSQTIISIAAGIPCEKYESCLGEGVAVIRVMPNINAQVLAAGSGICCGRYATEESLQIAQKLFSTIGKTYIIEEKLFPAYSAICGSSGAFVLLYIDALSEAGVRAGFPRMLAEEFAEQTVLGSAILAGKSTEHPIALMDSICSPGGSTIEGICKLKELGFESAVQQAILSIIDKDSKLGGN